MRTIVNLAIRENGPVTSNVFSGTFIPDDGAKQRRAPIPSGTIERVQLDCQKLDDEDRWLISKIVKTGVSFYYLYVYERANKTPPYQV